MLSHLDDFSRILKIERNYSNNTISSYLSDLKSFDSFLEKNGIDFEKLNNKHTKLFFRDLSKKKFSLFKIFFFNYSHTLTTKTKEHASFFNLHINNIFF